MSGPELVRHLWRLYDRASRKPSVEDELERLFPDDDAKQSEYRDQIIDLARRGGPEADRRCDICKRTFKGPRARDTHMRVVHDMSHVDRDAIAQDRDDGYSIAEIAERQRCSESTVSRIVQEMDLPRRVA